MILGRTALAATLLALACVPAATGGARGTPSLVYVKSDAIWIAAVDGSKARQLTAGFAPQISRDGRSVAFARASASGARSLYVVQTGAGATPRLLARGLDAFSWSPDSRHLAVEIGPRLAVLDTGTGTQVTIDRAPARFGSSLGFGFSPSGEDIVWVRPVRTMGAVYTGDLFRAASTGGPVQRLTRDGRNSDPVWGPDAIAFGRFEPGTEGKPFDRPFQLWTIAPDGSGARRVATRRYLTPVAWSDDGRRLLACFVAEFSCAPAAVDPLAGSVRALYRGAAARQTIVTASLSHDGRFVLVTQGVFEVRQDVAQVPYAGGGATVLVRDGDWPDWNR